MRRHTVTIAVAETYVPACDPFAVGEHDVEIRTSEQDACHDAPEAVLVLVLNMFLNLGNFRRQRRERVRVLPLQGRARGLNISKAAFRDSPMHSRPAQGKRSYPKRKSRDRSFAQRFNFVKLNNCRWWGQSLQRTRVMVEITNGRKRSMDGKSIIEDWQLMTFYSKCRVVLVQVICIA